MSVLPVTRGSLLLRLRGAADGEAWTEFTRVYGPAVFAYFRRRGLQEADAIDLTQDVFSDLSRKLREFEYEPGRGRFRGWLFRIARWRLLKFVRAKKRDRVALSDSLFEVPAIEEDGVAWQREVRSRFVEVALEELRPSLNDSTFEAFRLTAIEGQSGEEVAEKLGISRAAVYLAKVRVLAKLRERVSQFEEDALDPDPLDFTGEELP